MDEAFYIPDGDRFISARATMGPWDQRSQHGGPPAALLGRALERCEPREGFRVARVTFEILRPVPIAPLSVRAQVVRPGRSVELLEAVLAHDGQEVMRASAWRLVTSPDTAPATGLDDPPPPGPAHGRALPFFHPPERGGYAGAMECLFVEGAFLEPGPAKAWMRMRIPLVPSEEPSPLQRVLIAADSGNGVSAALDARTHQFINTDLSVHTMREPAGEWVMLDAITRADPGGIGLTETVLWDERGRIGRATQTLLVRSR